MPVLLDKGLRVIDLSGAFRFHDASLYPRWYGFEHSAVHVLDQAVYGLTELEAARVASARFVSNPGCYATSIILALAPLVEEDWLEPSSEIICDSKSGVSGAGRAATEKSREGGAAPPSRRQPTAEIGLYCRLFWA